MLLSVHFGTALQLSYISVAASTIATHPATFVANAADSLAGAGVGGAVVVAFPLAVGGAGVAAGVGGAGVGGAGVGGMGVGILVGAWVAPAGSGVGIIVGAVVGAGVATVIVLETVARFPP